MDKDQTDLKGFIVFASLFTSEVRLNICIRRKEYTPFSGSIGGIRGDHVDITPLKTDI